MTNNVSSNNALITAPFRLQSVRKNASPTRGRKMLLRAVLLLVVVVVCSATSCVKGIGTGIAVTPDSTLSPDSARAVAFALAASESEQFGLRPYQYADEDSALRAGFSKCYHQPRVVLCGKTKEREVQFRLLEMMRRVFSPHADSLRVSLLDRLRSRFGDQAVRECKWRYERDDAKSGCPLLAAAASRQSARLVMSFSNGVTERSASQK